MMSILRSRCRQCRQLGFHPTQNWHPNPGARQTHVLLHLRHDFTGNENQDDAQLLQQNQFGIRKDICFPHLNGNESEDLEEVCCAECGAVVIKKELLAHCLKEHKKEMGMGRHNTKRTRAKKKPSKKAVSHVHEHQGVHSGERPFPCHKCGKTFKKNYNLMVHQRAIHKTHNPFLCMDCGKGFREKRKVRRHKETVHLKQRPFKCLNCTKSFGQKEHLNRHQAMVHDKEKPFSCEVCGQKFALKEALQRHQVTVHEKQKSFECHECGKKFGQKYVLMRHERVHSGEKPYECGECKMRFGRSDKKSQHEKDVHKKPGL